MLQSKYALLEGFKFKGFLNPCIKITKALIRIQNGYGLIQKWSIE